MPSQLASDVDNKEFVGASNPDSALFVEFYMHEPIDKWSSEEASYKEGKRVVKRLPKQEFVRIMKPGDNTSVIETAVREDHKRRWPEAYLYFQMQEGLIDGGSNIPGWKVEEWPHLSEQHELLRELKFKRFYTVEQIAGASDHQIQGLGHAGQGLREQARVALRERISKEMTAEIAQRDKKISEQGSAIAELQAQVQQLLESATKPKAR